MAGTFFGIVDSCRVVERMAICGDSLLTEKLNGLASHMIGLCIG